MNNFSDTTIKALLTGAVACVGSAYLFGETSNYNVAGLSLPSFVIIGGSAAGGSWVADAFSDNIINMIPQNPKYAKAESLAVRLGLAGATTALAMKFTTDLPNENLIKAVALGAGSKGAGEWINTNVVSVQRNGFML